MSSSDAIEVGVSVSSITVDDTEQRAIESTAVAVTPGDNDSDDLQRSDLESELDWANQNLETEGHTADNTDNATIEFVPRGRISRKYAVATNNVGQDGNTSNGDARKVDAPKEDARKVDTSKKDTAEKQKGK